MASNENGSLVKKVLELWVEFKVVKEAAKLIAPIAVVGAGYYLYKKYTSPSSLNAP